MSTIIISATDPGGGNSVFPLLSPLRKREYKVMSILENESCNMWDQEGERYIDAGTLSESFLAELFEKNKPNLVITGTSAGVTIEKKITKEARNRNISCIAVLDFWSHYWQRFSSPGKKDFMYLPDVVCVMDDVAKQEMVDEGFDEGILYVTGNPHFDHFADGITSLDEDSERIVFISQPLSTLSEKKGFTEYGYDEMEVLSDIVGILEKEAYNYTLVIRPHPKEDPSKFDMFKNRQVRVSNQSSLVQDISSAGLIVGMCSSVLLQAAIAQKKVISYQPNLIGKDPLVSNRYGWTHGIYKKGELKDAIEKYFLDTLQPSAISFSSNATKNVLHVIDEFIK